MSNLNPPIATKKTHKIMYHLKEYTDDYFWLRNKESNDVLDYLKAENSFFEQKMNQHQKLVDELFQEMVQRTKEDDVSVPEKYGSFYYYYRIEKGKNYKIYCRKKESIDAPEEIILDLNKLAEGKNFLRMGSYDISHDHKFIAYTLDYRGYENFELFVKSLETNEEKKIQVSNLADDVLWGLDNSTIFYCKRDKINRTSEFYRGTFNIGSDKEIVLNEDLLYYELDDTYFLTMSKTKDNNYIILTSLNKETTEVRFLNIIENELKIFKERKLSILYHLDYHNGYFYIRTNDKAINFKLLRVKKEDYKDESKWEVFVPENEEVTFESLEMFENFIVVYIRKNGLQDINIFNIKTSSWKNIPFPEQVYAINYRAKPNNFEFKSNELRFYYESLKTPRCVYSYNMTSNTLELKKKDEIIGFDPAEYVMERIFVIVRDNMKVPISIIYSKNIEKNGKNPLYLVGYGSYGITNDPRFNPNIISLLKRGFIYVIAHIRGGGEMGRKWYLDGKYFTKKNTFYDFIDVAKYLIQEKYTSADKLAITGRSAGGLLMGAVLNMNPELFKVAVADVPFVDVINTMMDASIPLTTFEYEEWGDPRKIDFYDYMLSYSPYDNIKEQNYPHILFTAGLNDSRVAYWEPAKFIAKLRTLKTDRNDLLFKVNMGAGHQGASGKYDSLKEFASEFAFILTHI